jgi:DNA-binding transcriptional LysR family regulator
MNLRSIDLNLLVALDALLSQRHVTKAADRVGLSQPAMSNALGRLRAMFSDELLVRTATGMKPTPRATELVEPLRQLLRQVEQVLQSDSGFDPETSDRTFTIRMSDILACVMLPLLAARRPRQSRLGYNILHLSPVATVDALERDEIVPRVLKKTDLIAVMPRYLAIALMDEELRMEELPFKSAPFDWMMYWHRRYDQSRANRWLRDQVAEVCAQLS